MKTPIVDFVRSYAARDTSRLHMPGHKGRPFLGCEPLDITEIAGADALYEAGGIIAESEANAAVLFGTGHTFYSTEGSSQCIRAMLRLAVAAAPQPADRPVIVAARNVHKTFLSAAALLDFDVCWLWPDATDRSVCSCTVTPNVLTAALDALSAPPAAVYVTSPDYLGNVLDVAGLAAVCAARQLPLLVDNAHGAYHHFLAQPDHPIDLGATACCDSGHKTLPVLTGGAYLHLAKDAPAAFVQNARSALALFGSTSPSYLTLQSLDLCNRYLANGYGARLSRCIAKLERLKLALAQNGWVLLETEPLKLTLDAAACGQNGTLLADQLRRRGVECEFADPDFVVLMFTPENREMDFARVADALGKNTAAQGNVRPLPLPAPGTREMSIRNAFFAPHETISVCAAAGRICAAPTVSCPPAVPIVVSGERITTDAVSLFQRYRITAVEVVKE